MSARMFFAKGHYLLEAIDKRCPTIVTRHANTYPYSGTHVVACMCGVRELESFKSHAG